jgi:hypothetical protein
VEGENDQQQSLSLPAKVGDSTLAVGTLLNMHIRCPTGGGVSVSIGLDKLEFLVAPRRYQMIKQV